MKLFNYALAGFIGVGLGNTKADAVVLTLAFYLLFQAANKIGKDYLGKA